MVRIVIGGPRREVIDFLHTVQGAENLSISESKLMRDNVAKGKVTYRVEIVVSGEAPLQPKGREQR